MTDRLEIDPADATDLTELIDDRATRYPEKTAYLFLKNGEKEEGRLTYRDLHREVLKTASLLRSIGTRGQRVLLLYPPGLDYIVAFFGCLYAGAAAVPVYPPNPARPERTLPRLLGIVTDCRPSVALTSHRNLDRIAPLFAREAPSMRCVATDLSAPESGRLSEFEKPDLSPETVAFLQYTSGSTGAPKGVMVSHGNLLHNEAMIHRVLANSPEKWMCSWLPLYHDMGLIGNVIQTLYAGGSCVLMSPMAFLQRPLRWLRAIADYGATVSGGPNFAYDLCVRRSTPEDRTGFDLSGWGVAFNGSEPVQADVMERFAEAFAGSGFRWDAFFPCYGLAEATLFVAGGPKEDPPLTLRFDEASLAQNRARPAEEEAGRGLVASGAPMDGQTVAIVEPETRHRLGEDQVGEIWVSGDHVGAGYWEKSDLNERIFGARTSDGEDGPFLRTGDLGFLHEGQLFVTGRLKDLIIIRGRNHYPQDIEKTAQESYPLVRPGCCAAFEVEIDGERRLAVAAEVERRHLEERRSPAADPKVDRDRRWIKERRRHVELPEHTPDHPDPYVPDAAIDAIRQAVAEIHELQVHVVVLLKVGTIPKTSSGKIRRRACRDGFLKGTLDVVGRNVLPASAVPPPGDGLDRETLLALPEEQRQERLLAYMTDRAAALLTVDPKGIDPDAPLTSLGLDSLMAIEWQHAIETDLGIIWPMSRFIAGPSIRDLAREGLERLYALPADHRTAVAVAADTTAGLPLSHNQASLWFLHRLAPESAAYNVFFALETPAETDLEALKRAFLGVAERHPALRSRFSEENGGPVQRTVPPGEAIAFDEVEAGDWSGERLREALAASAHRPFDLEKGPLVRLDLYRRRASTVLLLNVHHIVVDLWSLNLMLAEIGALYAAGTGQGTRPSSPAPARTYTDFVAWQGEILSGPEGVRLSAYWREKLAGAETVLNLPTDRPRPPVQTYAGDAHGFSLDEGLTRRLKDLAREREATPYMVLLAAFQLLLSRYSGQTDLLVGSPAAGRNRAEFSDVAGYFVNPMVLRGDLSGDPAFVEFLNRTRSTVLEALDHQAYPFQKVVEDLQPERDPSRSPLFQAVFVLEKPHLLPASAPFVTREGGAEMALGDLRLTSHPLPARIAPFDLTLMMTESEDRFLASLEYNTDLFDKASIQRMAGHFQALLAGIVAAPDRPVSQIEWVPEAERQRILSVFNDTRVDYPAEKGIAGLFEAAAARWPDRQAVVFSGRSLTYRDLNRRANGLARLLGGEGGLPPEAPVGVMMARSERLPAVLLGILKAGGAYLPLDPTYPPERLRFMLADAGAEVVVVDPETAALHSEALAGRRLIDPEEIPEGGDDNPPGAAGGRRLALIIYTSGSTGRPKGTLIEHRSVLRLVINVDYLRLDASTRMPLTASLAFDVSTLQIWGPLLNGGTLLLPEEGATADPAALKALIAGERATTLLLTASLFNQLAETDPDLFAGVRQCMVGGEKLSAAHLARVQARHPDLTLLNGYGPTENTTQTTCYPIPRPAAGEIPIGRPIANTTVYILDAWGALCPIGVPGEICTGGDGVARGYLNLPERTGERFIPDPFSDNGGRLYRTGDIGYWRPDGDIVFLGRNDDQVKVRGHRVELGEIQRALTALPGVEASVVLASRYTAGYKEIAAYVTGAGELSAAFLRKGLSQHLPDYMIPSYFVRMERFPLTANGKVDRDALPDPTEGRPDTDAAYVEPGTETERRIAAVWAEVLGLPRVGVHDNFFDLGGNSLKMVRLKSRLEEVLGGTFPVVSLFRHPTIAAFAAFLTTGDADDIAAGRERARRRDTRQEALRQQRQARRQHRSKR